MRKNLVDAWIMVFGFWWLMISFFSIFGESNDWSPSVIMSRLSLTGMSALWGMLLASLIFLMSRTFHKSQLVGTNFRGINVNLGPFPNNTRKIPQSKQRVTQWHPKLGQWVEDFGRVHPKHVALLEAVARLLDAHPLHPASIEPGGHGDRTLVDHSHYVAEFMLRMAHDFDYRGVRNQETGEYEQIDTLFKFKTNDPLIPIIGLSHDIGKIACYEVTNEGMVLEKRSQHDWRGRLIMSTLPEFWALPDLDRGTILDAIGFYHHPWEMPLSVPDRPRAMVELVLMADKKAGEYESEHPRMATSEDVYQMVRRILESRGEDPENARLPDYGFPYEVNLHGQQLSLHQSRLLYYFEELLCDQGSINGGDPAKRIAIKIGDVIYCHEESVRERLGKLLSAKRLIDAKNKVGETILIRSLLEVLALRGSLLRELKGHEFSPGQAMFKLVAINDNVRPREIEWPGVFMVDAKAYLHRGVGEIESLGLSLVSITPVFGWRMIRGSTKSAIGKAPKKVKSETKPEAPVGSEESLSEAAAAPTEEDIPLPAEPIPAYEQEDPDDHKIYSVSDHSEGALKDLHDAGNTDLKGGVDNTLSAAMAIPDKAVKKEKGKSQTERRHERRAERKALSPVNTGEWWEQEDGQKLAEIIIQTVRQGESGLEIKHKEIEGIGYSLCKLVPLLTSLNIPGEAAEAKATGMLNERADLVIRKGADGSTFVGVPDAVMENI